MFRKNSILSHASSHLDGADDEIASALDLLAPRFAQGVLPAAGPEYENSIQLADDGSLYHCDGSAWTPFEGGGGAKPFPTILVAASDAILTTGADYICDGTADQTDINNAILDLGVTGGIVQLTEGTFTLSGSIVMESNVTLRGCGYATKIKWAAGVSASTDMIPASIVDNVVIEDLWFDGTGVTTSRILELTSCNNWLIQRCTFTNSTDAACYMDACSWIVISKNRFSGSARPIRSVTTTAACSKLCITQNLIQSPTQNAIDLSGADYSYIGRNNVIQGTSGKHTCYLWQCDYTVVANNYLGGRTSSPGVAYDVYDDGCDMLVVRGNDLLGSAVNVNLYGSAGFGANVSGNCMNNSQFLFSDRDINYSTVVGNACRGVVTGLYGFDVRDAIDSVFAFNLIYNIGLNGIILQNGSGGGNGVDNCVVVGNRIDQTAGTADGVALNSGSTINLLIGNLVTNAASGYGIDVHAGANNGHCQMNHVRGNTSGWRDSGTGTMKGANTTNNNDIA